MQAKTQKEADFLATMIDILRRLHAASNEHGHVMLAALLDLARAEARDVYDHVAELEALNAKRSAMSSRHTWRADDDDSYSDDGSVAA